MNPYQAARLKPLVFATHCPCGAELWVPGASWEPGMTIQVKCPGCHQERTIALYITASVKEAL